MQTATRKKEQLFAIYDWYHAIRTAQSVAYHEQFRAWQVFRYADKVRWVQKCAA